MTCNITYKETESEIMMRDYYNITAAFNEPSYNIERLVIILWELYPHTSQHIGGGSRKSHLLRVGF